VRQLLRFVKTIVVGGLLFLFPLVFVTFVVGKAFAMLLGVTRPIVDDLAPSHSIAGVAVVNFVTIAGLIAGCFVAGLIARSPLGRRLYRSLDNNLAGLLPGYAILRARLGDAIGKDARRKSIRTVLVRFDDYSQLAFEIERLPDGQVVAFLPGAPDPWSGTSVIVDAARVTPLDLEIMQLTRLLKDLGWGTAAAFKDAPRAA
jgi:uncharacterized membrane protein